MNEKLKEDSLGGAHAAHDTSGLIAEIVETVKESQNRRREEEIRECRQILGLNHRSTISSDTVDDEEVLKAAVRRAEVVHPDYSKHPDAKIAFSGGLPGFQDLTQSTD